MITNNQKISDRNLLLQTFLFVFPEIHWSTFPNYFFLNSPEFDHCLMIFRFEQQLL